MRWRFHHWLRLPWQSCTAIPLLVWFAHGMGAAADPAAQADAVAEPGTVTYLEYTEQETSYANWGLPVIPQNESFTREPDAADQNAVRGHFKFGSQDTNNLKFVWYRQKGELRLDLNRNGDLTDDADGVFSSSKIQSSRYWQVFTNVHLRFPTDHGAHRFLVDLRLYSAGYQTGGSAAPHSFWQGRVTLRGQDWQVGLMENYSKDVADPSQGRLLVRPWESRTQPLDLSYVMESVDGCSFAPSVFLQDQGYKVTCAFERGEDGMRCKATFHEQQPALGELKLEGQFIDRLALDAGPYLVLLNQPGATAKVPVGTYPRCRVQLKQGESAASRTWQGSRASDQVTITKDQPAQLKVGGPLTNSVTARQQGRRLVLSYQLVGADGATYRMNRPGPVEPPRFNVYQGDHRIHSGQFEFG